MEFSKILSVIASDLEEVEREIGQNIESPVPLVSQISRYFLGSDGKSMCPSVVILSAGACGLQNGRNRIASAAALELLRVASTLHDNVTNKSNRRTGESSSSKIPGNEASVLVGDFLLSRAFALVQSCENLELLKVVAGAAESLAEGQVLASMSGLSMIEPSEKVCYEIIKKKTGSLMESCGKAGAILGGATDEVKDAIAEFGFNLGIASQLVDDAHRYSSEEKGTGTDPGHDLLKRILTLPLLYSLPDATHAEKSRVLDFLRNENLANEDLPIILDVVWKYNGVQQTKNAAIPYAEKAKKAIVDVPNNNYKQSFNFLADYVIEKSK
jgi:octaprenyl-diphosphate synthase